MCMSNYSWQEKLEHSEYICVTFTMVLLWENLPYFWCVGTAAACAEREKEMVWIQIRLHCYSNNLGDYIKMHGIMMAVLWVVIQVCITPLCMVQCTHLITRGGTPHLYNEGLECWLTLCILEKICNFTNSVQISFIQTIKLIVYSWAIRWC